MYSGIPVKVSDDVYALIKDGKELFRGTKAEIEALAEKLKKMSDAEASKYIDELVKLKNAFKFKNFASRFFFHFPSPYHHRRDVYANKPPHHTFNKLQNLT